MPQALPVVLDQTQSPPILREIAVNEQLPGENSLPAGGSDGQVLTKQSATDGDAAWEAPALAVANVSAGTISGADKAKLDGVAAGAEVNAASSLTSSSPNEAGAGELAVYSGKSGSTLQFRSLSGERGIEAEVVGSSIRIQRATSLWAPAKRSGFEAYRRKTLRSRRTAGAVGDAGGSDPWLPATLVDNHGLTDHLYPYMVPTGVDFYGLPHNRHKRLRSSSMGNDSGELGYEFGHDVAAGDARARSRFEWKLAGKVENVGWDDAFLEMAVEINPTVGVYDHADLARMLSPELGATWSGERHFTGRVFLEVTGPDSWDVWGEFRIYSSTGAVLREWQRGTSISGASHDWLTDAARVQLRWKVDRDLATQADVFDGFNQGDRQGSDLLRLHIDSYDYEPLLAEIS